MRPRREHRPQAGEPPSIQCFEVTVPSFEFYWHYHPEYELTYIVKGRGRRLVGDSQEAFSEGDLVLLGPNLPHTWVGDSRSEEPCRAVVLKFSAAVFGVLAAIPDSGPATSLLKRSASGLHFPYAGNKLPDLFDCVRQAGGIQALAYLLLLLDSLTRAEALPLASAHFLPLAEARNEQRLQQVFKYVQEDFAKGISLREAAQRAHLSVSAFCKFFKKATGKTFSDYVNEARITHACTLLLETDKPIGMVAEASGFENLAYFNRVFLKKKEAPPGQWRRRVGR